MSFYENWGPGASEPGPVLIPFRILPCGHVMHSAEQPTKSSECPVCQEPVAEVCKPRDFVPRPNLTWSGASKQESRHLNFKHNKLVCYLSSDIVVGGKQDLCQACRCCLPACFANLITPFITSSSPQSRRPAAARNEYIWTLFSCVLSCGTVWWLIFAEPSAFF